MKKSLLELSLCSFLLSLCSFLLSLCSFPLSLAHSLLALERFCLRREWSGSADGSERIGRSSGQLERLAGDSNIGTHPQKQQFQSKLNDFLVKYFSIS